MDRQTRSTGALALTVRRIEMGIQRGQWEAEKRLPSERALAESFGVSRATVREAIARLTSRGLVEARRGSGVYLLASKPVSIAAPWLQLISDVPPSRLETLEFRLVIECAAARLAAQRCTTNELENIAAILERMRESVIRGDIAVEASTDCEFHSAIAATTQNRLLDRFYASVITMLRDHISSNTFDASANASAASSRAHRRLHQHESIYNAIRDRDPDAAQLAMMDHINFVGNQFKV